jgi:mono/diheme cytochrome c family protein
MIKTKTLLFLLSLIPFLRMGSTPPPSKQENGEALYYKHCKSCHMKKGQGLFRLYPPLTDSNWVGNDSLIVRNITRGISGPIEVNGKEYDREMPPVKGLTNAEIAAIINYIRTTITEINKPISAQKVGELRGS